MRILSRLTPDSMSSQMILVLALSLTLLLTSFIVFEIFDHDNALETAESKLTLHRLKRIKPILEEINSEQLEHFLDNTSSCHEGYTVTETPFNLSRTPHEVERLKLRLTRELNLENQEVLVGYATLSKNDFYYRRCNSSEIDLPLEAIVISLALKSGKWLNAEVHHEWHSRYIIGWILRISGAFIFISGIGIFFMHRVSKPLKNLTDAAQKFGSGLVISKVHEDGPPDLKRAIQSFNAMQQQVADEVARRSNTLATISHDVRTPLTALRVKAELIDDIEIRHDLIASINKMEKITRSALEFLKGESRAESKRDVNLHALIKGECDDFIDMGYQVELVGHKILQARCRPDALARALRNLIENAIKYAKVTKVRLHLNSEFLDISVIDEGPGIPENKIEAAMAPFERLSKARESSQGGFGLGLAAVKAIAEGHDGELILKNNKPTGLIATIRIPVIGQHILIH